MPNINVKKSLERIAEEMESVAKHVEMYSGVSVKDRKVLMLDLREISEYADRIAKVVQAA